VKQETVLLESFNILQWSLGLFPVGIFDGFFHLCHDLWQNIWLERKMSFIDFDCVHKYFTLRLIPTYPEMCMHDAFPLPENLGFNPGIIVRNFDQTIDHSQNSTLPIFEWRHWNNLVLMRHKSNKKPGFIFGLLEQEDLQINLPNLNNGNQVKHTGIR